MINKNHALVVGAGPIGLLTAIGLKTIHPTKQIIILEKYSEYQRKHTLIMDYKHLESFRDAIGSDNEALNSLVDRIKQDKHIRTSELQETLERIATSLGVSKEIKEVKDVAAILEEKQYHNVDMIIGADGTKGVVGEQLFHNNKQKFDFDYVVQLRYQVEGEIKAENIDFTDMSSLMAQHGVLATEYVGRQDEKSNFTPVTTQFMISREAFLGMKAATSKNPYYPFSEMKNTHREFSLPEKVNDFIKDYVTFRLKCYGHNSEVDLSNLTVSVNEAPATRATKVVDRFNGRQVLLVGDAALGLSYFKGLNAGVESCAVLMRHIKANNDLQTDYQRWFDAFATRKIQEVANYSRWVIGSGESVFKIANQYFSKLTLLKNGDSETWLDLYSFNQQMGVKNFNGVYSHREYMPVHDFYVKPDNAKRSLRAISKHLVDNFKPYKSVRHFLKDLIQPLMGVYYSILSGLLKLVFGFFVKGLLYSLFSLNLFFKPKESFIEMRAWLLDGFSKILLGLYLIVTTLFLPVRLVTRALSTLINGVVLIENNRKLNEYLLKCNELLTKETDQKETITQLFSFCVDIHRKFAKAVSRGQRTNIDVLQEDILYNQFFVNVNNFYSTADTKDHKHSAASAATELDEKLRYIKLYLSVFKRAKKPSDLGSKLIKGLPLFLWLIGCLAVIYTASVGWSAALVVLSGLEFYSAIYLCVMLFFVHVICSVLQDSLTYKDQLSLQKPMFCDISDSFQSTDQVGSIASVSDSKLDSDSKHSTLNQPGSTGQY